MRAAHLLPIRDGPPAAAVGAHGCELAARFGSTATGPARRVIHAGSIQLSGCSACQTRLGGTGGCR